MGYLTELSGKKIVFEHFFTAKLKTFVFLAFLIFLYDLFTNKARKLEVAEWNPIMEKIPISLVLSVGWDFFPSFSGARFISLSLSLYIYIYIFIYISVSLFVDTSHQLLLCGVMSFLILINNVLY